MRTTVFAAFVFLALALAGCSKHPLDGGWHQHADAGHGRTFEFDPDSDALKVHGAHRADGTHDDFQGTYRLDGTTVTVEWTEGGAKMKWTGELKGDAIEFRTDDGKAEFHRGAAGH